MDRHKKQPQSVSQEHEVKVAPSHQYPGEKQKEISNIDRGSKSQTLSGWMREKENKHIILMKNELMGKVLNISVYLQSDG